MTQNMIRQTVLTVGERQNQPRIWIEGLYLQKAGFNKGDKINVIFKEDKIEILKNTQGEKIVSGKKNPLIDINNSKILQVFNISDKIQVIVELGKITISKTKIAIRKLTAKRDKTHADIFGGGGLMSKAMELAGFKTKWAIEKDQKYADIYQRNHDCKLYNCDISQVNINELESVELLSGGIPCENFSIARRNSDIEAETMDLSLFFMMVVEKINPRTIVLEEVPMYLESQIGIATIKALERLGYNVQCKTMSGNDYGMIQRRQRAVVIASYDKIEFPEPEPFTGTAKDILLDPSDPECEWFTQQEKQWIFDHWKNQTDKGNNFVAQIVTEATKSIQAITKRYNAIQPDKPLVKHPTEEKWRLFTITEQKRLFGLPNDYDLGEYKTYAGEVMGQGVLVTMFKKIAEKIAGTVLSIPKPEIKTNDSKSRQNDLSCYM